ncbi:YkoF family thiamine/hydroxymethylpyrimidine-binding protein [Winogradskyella aurantiaca]|uniref:YkoF family thiamine/hydroxymethylpyrimidine-binding protein n=1 Tax=Winogradskyella aurantiaca TaxID=2219558 RepID=UPI000E1DA209|nr:YkoF family thiamine/hydroxymethylpyrimidine-binding protein [Winogradskyella aurantiaca]
MDISIEFTLTPLKDDYEPHIIGFIKALRASEFTVLENPLSTQIFGDYDQIMPFLNQVIKESFEGMDLAVLNMKIVKTNRSDYEPHF